MGGGGRREPEVPDATDCICRAGFRLFLRDRARSVFSRRVLFFYAWNGVSTTVEWIGWDNFIRLMSGDRHFVSAFAFTVKFMVATVIITNTIAFLFALLLTRALKFRNLYRTIYFLPNVIGGLLLGYIFQFIFTRGFPALGELTGIGLFHLPWLGTAGTGSGRSSSSAFGKWRGI